MPGEFRPSLPGERRGGRKKGTPNKADASIKDMIITALSFVGGANYLARQAEENPVAFMGLVGRVLPLQLSAGDNKDPGSLHLIAASAFGLELARLANEHQTPTNGHAVTTIDADAIDLNAPPPEE